MKKSLIVIALALLMLVPVFATGSTNPISITTKGDSLDIDGGETPLTTAIQNNKNSTSTDVTLSLKLKPIYYAAITEVDGSNITKDTYNDDKYKNVAEVPMEVDDDLNLESNDEYYLTYFFYQNSQSVTLTVSIDQDMTCDDTRTEYDKKNGVKNTIEYNVALYEINAYTNYTTAKASATEGQVVNTPSAVYRIYSNQNDGAQSGDIAKNAGSMRLDNQKQHCYRMVISPEDDAINLKNNIAGDYISTITLKLTNV